MKLFVGLAVLVTLAFFASSESFYSLRRSRLGAMLLTGGWAIVAVGFLIGPFGAALVVPEQLVTLKPLIYFVLGWVGMVIGMQMHRTLPQVVGRNVIRMTVFDFTFSMLVIGGALIMILLLTDMDPVYAGAVALLLAVCGCGWSAEVRSLRIGKPGLARVTAAMRAIAGVASILSVVTYGIIVKSLTFADDGTIEVMSGNQILSVLGISVVTAIAVGVLGLWLMTLAEKNEGEFLLVLIGLVVTAAGAAEAMKASPLFVAMLTGAVIVNLPGKPLERFRNVIVQAEQPIAMSVMLVAGVLLDPQIGRVGIAVLLAILGARMIVKVGLDALAFPAVACAKGARAAHAGLMRQNPLAIAITIAFVVPQLALPDQAILPGRKLIAIIVFAGILAEVISLMRPKKSQDNKPQVQTTEGIE